MKRLSICVVMAAMFLSLASVTEVRAGEDSIRTERTPQGVTKSRERHMTATIAAMDTKNRTVTLVDDRGETMTLDVPESVNFDRVKNGDRVNLSYYESLAVAVGKGGQGGPRMQTQDSRADIAQTAEHGPGKAASRTVHATASIVSVDAKQNLVTVRKPDGKTQTVTVDDPTLRSKLSSVKPGDEVDLVYTRTVVGGLVPMPAKK